MIQRNSVGFLAWVLGLWLLSSCTQAPQQGTTGSPVQVEWEKQTLPTGKPIDIPVPPPEKPDDEKARENSLKPILYGVGAAGITFDTTLTEAKELLSKPFFGPRPSDGLTAYNSGMYVWWRLDSPRTPQMILLLSAYQGSLDLGEEFGKIKLGHDFSSEFTEQDPKGEALLAKIYNELEGVEEPTFDCVKEKICEVVDGENDFILSWPKMGLLISKDRKVLYRMIILDGVAQGKLDNDLDILSGSFEVKSEAGTERIGLGQKWQTVFESLGISPDTSVNRSLFTKDYSGIVLGLTKGHFEREYVEPEGEELLRVIAVYSGYKKKLKLGENFVKIEKSDEGIALSLVKEPSETDTLVELKLALEEKYHVEFTKELADLLVSELKAAAPEKAVQLQLTGLHADSTSKEYGISIVQYGQGSGKVLYVEVRESTGNIGYVEVANLGEPLDDIMVPAVAKAANPSDKSLSGFSIGQTLYVSDVDRGRDEATVQLANSDIKVRAEHNPNGTLEAVFESGKLETEKVQILRLGNLRVTLGVVPVADENTPEGATAVKVVSVSSGNHTAGTVGACGLSDLVLKPGTKDVAVKKQIDAALDAAKAVNSDFQCSYVVEEDANATGRITGIFFPENRMKVSFSDREMTSTTIYSRSREVQQ